MMKEAIQQLFLDQIARPAYAVEIDSDALAAQVQNKWGVILNLTSQPHFDYVAFIMRHKTAVYNAGIELLSLIELTTKDGLTDAEKTAFEMQLVVHDLSKLGAKESTGYMGYNFKDKTANTPEAIAAFELAWNHHYSTNEHHPEYWFFLDKGGLSTLADMPRLFALEMVADWIGAGKTYGKEVEEWLPANLPSFSFSEKTAGIVQDFLLNLLDIPTDRGTRFIFDKYHYLMVQDRSR